VEAARNFPYAMQWLARAINEQLSGNHRLMRARHRPEELGQGLALLEAGAADVVIASKYLPDSLVTNLSNHISDYSNGYRFYTREAAQRVAETHIVYGEPSLLD
jgi:hypothetical protein